MQTKDQELVNKAIEKVMKQFDYDIEDVLDADREEVVQAIKDGILENMEEQPPAIEWIELVELDEAETVKNGNGDFLSN